MGATGRLGRMLRRHWGDDPAITWTARRPAPGITVADPLAQSGADTGACTGAYTGALADLAQGCTAVLCLAGVTPAAAARGADWADDTRLALAALQAAHTAGAQCFICSSAAVYGRAGGVLHETAAPTPAAPYGQAKTATEAAVLEQAARTGQGVTILRIGNVAGADAILGGWRAGFRLDTFADGTTPARSYIGPRTLAYVLGHLMGARDLPPILNIASPGPVQMGDLLQAAGLAYTPQPAPEAAIARVALSTDLLQGLIPLAPVTANDLVAEWRIDQARAAG